MERFASRSVSAAFAQLFKRYRENSDFTNHCIVKMFHRIAFDCKLPALLFQVKVIFLLVILSVSAKLKIRPDTWSTLVNYFTTQYTLYLNLILTCRFAYSEGSRRSGRIGRCCEATRASRSCTSLANIS